MLRAVSFSSVLSRTKITATVSWASSSSSSSNKFIVSADMMMLSVDKIALLMFAESLLTDMQRWIVGKAICSPDTDVQLVRAASIT